MDRPAATGALVRYLTDPAIEEAIQVFVDTAPPMSEVKRARIARPLGTDRCYYEPRPNTLAAGCHTICKQCVQVGATVARWCGTRRNPEVF